MNSSENSSEETDQQEDHDCGGTRRSYECTFCRRGFTNAQALGGHMNIHRKDRAKAKQPNSSSSANKKLIISSDIVNEEPLLSSPYLSGQPTRYSNNNYSIFEAQRTYSYNMYFQPASNPRNPATPPSSYGFPYVYEYINARSRHHHQAMDMNQELLGPNLSLQIGPSPVENNEVVRRVIQKDGDVDLELRLGHYPYY